MPLETELDTVNKRVADAVRRFAARPAFSHKPHGAKDWLTIPYADFGEQVRRVALGLRALGVEHGDRVALLSENRPEWVIADFGAQAAGAVTVPIYPTLPPTQVAHILADSGAKALIASDRKQWEKARQGGGSALSVFVVMDDAPNESLSWDGLLEMGERAPFAAEYEAVRDTVQPDDLMSIVYTSGTTGNPKGAMLTHRALCASLDGATLDLPQYQPPHEVMLSFLPLCHIFERITSTLATTRGAHTYFNDTLFKLASNMAEVKPTVMVNVPRVYESIHERVIDGLAKAPPKRQRMAHWAIGIGEMVSERRSAGRSVSPLLAAQHAIADKLVLSKVRARFGGRFRFVVSGGAPLNPITERFFLAIGIPLLEVWGLTETGLATITPNGRPRVGTVGRQSAHTEVKTAPDGELLVRGANVMQGYWHLPEATAEAIDAEGWFHSGDIGVIDKDGYVTITDRKKDILVLANGKKVAPQPIEVMLKHSPLIAEVVLLGDKSETVKALVVPNFDALKAWAKEQNKKIDDPEGFAADPAARKLIKTEIDRLSTGLADFEKVKRIALLPQPFSIETGELTPTLKVKRKVVAEKFGSLLEKPEKE